MKQNTLKREKKIAQHVFSSAGLVVTSSAHRLYGIKTQEEKTAKWKTASAEQSIQIIKTKLIKYALFTQCCSVGWVTETKRNRRKLCSTSSSLSTKKTK